MRLLRATVIAALACLTAATALAAAAPRPQAWTADQMWRRLTLAPPITNWTSGLGIQRGACIGQGRRTAGRYAAFRCDLVWGTVNNGNMHYPATLYTRVLPGGTTGRYCVVATAPAFDGNQKAVPYKPGTLGLSVAPGRACP